MSRYFAQPCPCGHRSCQDWHVYPVAAVQSVKFTEDQAQAVAALLNDLHEKANPHTAPAANGQ